MNFFAGAMNPFTLLSDSIDMSNSNVSLLYNNIKLCTEFLIHGQYLLPNLQSITLSHMESPLHPSLLGSICRPLRSIISLELFECTFGFTLDLRRFMCSFFPNVTHLDLYGIKICSSHISLPPSLAQLKPPSLSNLTIKTHLEFLDSTLTLPPPVPFQIFRWLSWTQTLTTLQSLAIYTDDLPKGVKSFHHAVHSSTFCVSNGYMNSLKTFHLELMYCLLFKH
ncbi:hypothetical protein C8Q75DRAFT_139324 [Abortiporus biennis]|nr:hypothetical protein C8Q75DRAFT_139324 [Abortiporus biennis]